MARANVKSTGVVKSAGRTLEVFELFREVRRPLSTKEIAQRLGFPHSSTAALLSSLSSLQYLSYDRDFRVYFPTGRFAALGEWIVDYRVIGRKIAKLLEQLHHLTGETVIIAAQIDIQCTFLRVIPSRHPTQFYFPAGSGTLMCNSSAGYALMARLDEAAIRSLVHRSNEHFAKRSGKQFEVAKILRELKEVRRQGYAALWNSVVPDSGSIAIAIRPEIGSAPLAVAVGGPTKRLQPLTADIVYKMRACIKEQNLLGGTAVTD